MSDKQQPQAWTHKAYRVKAHNRALTPEEIQKSFESTRLTDPILVATDVDGTEYPLNALPLDRWVRIHRATSDIKESE